MNNGHGAEERTGSRQDAGILVGGIDLNDLCKSKSSRAMFNSFLREHRLALHNAKNCGMSAMVSKGMCGDHLFWGAITSSLQCSHHHLEALIPSRTTTTKHHRAMPRRVQVSSGAQINKSSLT